MKKKTQCRVQVRDTTSPRELDQSDCYTKPRERVVGKKSTSRVVYNTNSIMSHCCVLFEILNLYTLGKTEEEKKKD